jgi:hypothetical protein
MKEVSQIWANTASVIKNTDCFSFFPVLHQSQENFMKCQNAPNQKK